MANITLNDLNNPTGYVLFTDIPNILSVDEYNSDTKANILLHLNNNLSTATTKDNQWYIKINGETIANVLDYNNAINKNFYVGTSNITTAYYITRALRNCPALAANFSIPSDVSDDIYLFAKQAGDIPIDFETNIPDTYLEETITSGTSSTSLNNALVSVDITADEEYTTTLEKNAYNAKTAFDLSPVLSTVVDYGEATPFTLQLSSLKGGEAASLGTIGTNHIARGYKANDSLPYLYRNSGILLAQNIAGRLYIYGDSIPLSFYNPDNNAGATITIKYLNELREVINTSTNTWHNTDSTKKLKYQDIGLNQTYFGVARYIVISIGNTEAEYEIIKPVRATEGYTRIYWRNEYAGISFFDFSGEKTTSEAINNEEYRKNNFDYYTATIYEDRKLYDKTATQTVTVRSHLMKKDAIWIFNSLKKAKKVWTDENKAIIVQTVQVDEQANNNDVYIATITYTFSSIEQDD